MKGELSILNQRFELAMQAFQNMDATPSPHVDDEDDVDLNDSMLIDKQVFVDAKQKLNLQLRQLHENLQNKLYTPFGVKELEAQLKKECKLKLKLHQCYVDIEKTERDIALLTEALSQVGYCMSSILNRV
jgi:hypothetical protein